MPIMSGLLVQDIYVNQTKTSSLPGRRVLIGYWREIGTASHDATTSFEEIGGVRRSSSEVNELRRAMDGVLMHWERVRKDWSDKLAEMEVRGNLIDPTLKTVIELFCSPSEEPIEELERTFQVYPDDIIFYAPQLCTYLLYSPSPVSLTLKATVLHLCSEDDILAHKMHFFLRSFAVNHDISIDRGLQSLLRDITQFGEIAARKATKMENITRSSLVFPAITPAFHDNISFWSRLVEVTRALVNRRTKQERTVELQRQLLIWGGDLLPSVSIFVPVGNSRNIVWAIHTAECFAFSTKARVPIFICLEVVEYSKAKR